MNAVTRRVVQLVGGDGELVAENLLRPHPDIECDSCGKANVPLWVCETATCGCCAYGVCDACSEAEINQGDVVVLEPTTIVGLGEAK